MADDFDPEAFDFAMTQGTSAQRAAAKDFARGVKYAPFDLLGLAVDTVNMPLQAVGLGSDKPFLGSEYLIDKYASAVEGLGGSYARPTHSVDETAGRILGSLFVDPTIAAGIASKFGKFAKKGQGAEVTGTSTAQLDTPTRAPATITDVETGTTSVLEPSPKSTLPPGTKPGGLGEYGINPPVMEGYSTLYGSTYSPVDNAFSDVKILGFSPNLDKPSLTGQQIVARLKKQPSVTDAELQYGGLEAFFLDPANKNRKMSWEEANSAVASRQADLGYDELTGSQTVYDDEQRLVREEVGNYTEVVFQDNKAAELPGGYTSEYTHYSDMPGVIGHARGTYIDDAYGTRGFLVEEIQPELTQNLRIDPRVGNQTRNFYMGAEEATPQKIAEIEKQLTEIANTPELKGYFDTSAEITALSEQRTARRNTINQELFAEVTANRDRAEATLNQAREKFMQSIEADPKLTELAEDFYQTAAVKGSFRQLRDGSLAPLTKLDGWDEFSSSIQDFVLQKIKQESVLTDARYRTDILIQRGLADPTIKDLNERIESLSQTAQELFDQGTSKLGGSVSDVDIAAANTFVQTGKLPETKTRNLTPQSLFRNDLQSSRYMVHELIKRQANNDWVIGNDSSTVFFPDYRDIAAVRGKQPEEVAGFKTTYEDAPQKVIKELRDAGINIEVKKIPAEDFSELVEKVQKVVPDPEAPFGFGYDYGNSISRPVLSVTLDKAAIDKLTQGSVRRFAKGGPVDLRTGIGDLFRLYS